VDGANKEAMIVVQGSVVNRDGRPSSSGLRVEGGKTMWGYWIASEVLPAHMELAQPKRVIWRNTVHMNKKEVTWVHQPDFLLPRQFVDAARNEFVVEWREGGREERQSFKVEARPNGFPAAAEAARSFLLDQKKKMEARSTQTGAAPSRGDSAKGSKGPAASKGPK
jgi:hypothetical protein